MSLDVAKLQNVRELAGGIVQAGCPACAEGGHDRAGNHLRIYPDGRFGCCVHPKDGEHRKRIFALVGVRKPGTFALRLKTPPALSVARSVKAALTSPTLKTPETELEDGVRTVRDFSNSNSRTARTGCVGLCARARVDSTIAGMDGEDIPEKLKDWEGGVRDVRCSGEGEPPIAAAPCGGPTLPFLTADGSLSIPFDSPERYHWWDGGQSVAETLAEVKERMKHAVNV